MDMTKYLPQGMAKYHDSLFRQGRVDLFYAVLFGVGAVCTVLTGVHWVATLLMAAPLIPIFDRFLSNSKEDAFFEEFDEDALNLFATKYAASMSEFDDADGIASDLFVLKDAWEDDDAQATLVSLMHMMRKMELMHDCYQAPEEDEDLQQAELPAVRAGEEAV